MAKYKGYIYIILSAVIFGLAPLFSVTIYENGGDSLNVMLFRVLFSLPILYILLWRTTKTTETKMTVTKAELRKLFILALSSVGTGILLLMSYTLVSTGTATTIHFIYPVLVLVGCVVFLKEPVNRIKVICVALSFLGVVMFYEPGEGSGFSGMIVAFVSGITYAFYVIYLSKSGLQDMESFKLIFYVNLISTFMVVVYYIASGSEGFVLTPLGWTVSIIYSLIFIVAFVSFQRGVKLVGPQSASILSTFEPITSIVVGVFVFNENFTLKSFLGIIAILVSVSLITIFDNNNGKDVKQSTDEN